MNPARALAVTLATAALAACAPTSRTLAPEALEAVQTRTVEAQPDAAFRAAVGVLLDRGMIVTLSERGAGLVAASTYLAGPGHDHAASPGVLNGSEAIVVWVNPVAPGRCNLRIQHVRAGGVVADAGSPSAFAAEVDQRLVMAARPARGTP